MSNRSQEITGFTLFYTWPVKNGWQMSVRRKAENGWCVTMIPEEQAKVILSMLQNSGHPDGPWEVKAPDDAAEFYEQQRERWLREMGGPAFAVDENGETVLPAGDLATELFYAAEAWARLAEVVKALAP